MLFFGGFITGIIFSIGIAITCFILWKKIFKKKVDEAIFKAGLKAIESQKGKE